MGLIVDGIRSTKRKWFADRLLEKIRMIGVPAKALVVNGFLFRVSWQDDVVNTRHIAAPMGAVVVSFGARGAFIYSAEYYLGGFDQGKELYRYSSDMADNDMQLEPNLLAWITTQIEAVLQQKEAAASQPLRLFPPGNFPSSFPGNPFVYPQPALFPVLYSEQVVLQYAEELSRSRWERPRQDDNRWSGRIIAEQAALFFNQNGSQQIRTCVVDVQNGPSPSEHVIFNAPVRNRLGLSLITLDREITLDGNNSVVFAHIVTRHSSDDWRRYLLINLEVALPDGLRPIFFKPSVKLPYHRLAEYGFPLPGGEFQYIVAVLMSPVISGGSTDFYRPFFYENSGRTEIVERRKWKLVLLIARIPALSVDMTQDEERAALAGTTVQAVTADQFMPLLHELSGNTVFSLIKYGTGPLELDNGDCEVAWGRACYVLQSIMAFFTMNESSTIPHDSVRFHAGATMYTWTRFHGGFAIDAGGIRRIAMTMPPEVGREGVKPDITHGGDGVYLCPCEDVGNGIPAVYVGTPFDGGNWTRLPLEPEGWEGVILHVRPMLATRERVALLAIVKERDGEGKARFRLAVADGAPDECRLAMGSVVPVEDEDELRRFAVTLYGNGNYVKYLEEYPSPPVAYAHRVRRENYGEYVK